MVRSIGALHWERLRQWSSPSPEKGRLLRGGQSLIVVPSTCKDIGEEMELELGVRMRGTKDKLNEGGSEKGKYSPHDQ